MYRLERHSYKLKLDGGSLWTWGSKFWKFEIVIAEYNQWLRNDPALPARLNSGARNDVAIIEINKMHEADSQQ